MACVRSKLLKRIQEGSAVVDRQRGASRSGRNASDAALEAVRVLRSVPGRYRRAQFEGRGLRVPLSLWAVIAVGLSALGFAVADLPLAHGFYGMRAQGSPVTGLFLLVERLGDSTWYLIVSALLAAFFAWLGLSRYKKPLLVFLSIGLAGTAVNIIKIMLGRARPLKFLQEGLYGLYGFELDASFRSFPSGHAATALALAGSLAFLFPKARRFWWTAGVIVAFSRVITCEHYFSDFVFGSFIGAASAVVLSRVLFTPPMKDSGTSPIH